MAKIISFGVVGMGTSNLGRLLVTEGLLTEPDRMTIVRTCGGSPAAFAKGVLALGLLDEDELVSLLANRTTLKVAPKDLASYCSPELLQSLDHSLFAQLEVLPIALKDDVLTVAMADPLDRTAVRQLEFFTRYKIKPVIAPLTKIREALSQVIEDFAPSYSALEEFLTNHADGASRRLHGLGPSPTRNRQKSEPSKPKAIKPRVIRTIKAKAAEAEDEGQVDAYVAEHLPSDAELMALPDIDGDHIALEGAMPEPKVEAKQPVAAAPEPASMAEPEESEPLEEIATAPEAEDVIEELAEEQAPDAMSASNDSILPDSDDTLPDILGDDSSSTEGMVAASESVDPSEDTLTASLNAADATQGSTDILESDLFADAPTEAPQAEPFAEVSAPKEPGAGADMAALNRALVTMNATSDQGRAIKALASALAKSMPSGLLLQLKASNCKPLCSWKTPAGAKQATVETSNLESYAHDSLSAFASGLAQAWSPAAGAATLQPLKGWPELDKLVAARIAAPNDAAKAVVLLASDPNDCAMNAGFKETAETLLKKLASLLT